MPDYSGDSFSQAVGQLSGFGTRLGAFNQSSFRENAVTSRDGGRYIQSSVGGRGLGEGYCAGVCLDWIRRVLFSAPDRDQSFLTYGAEQLEAGRGAHGHSASDTSERSYQSVGRMAQAWYQRNDVHWTAPGGTEDWSLNAEEFRTMVRTLDNVFDRSRREVGRETTDKPFSDLVVMASHRHTYPDARSWMMAAIAASRPGACIQMNFNRTGVSGHAVVAWQRLASHDAANAFYFFDPNFGAFAYDRRGLAQAIQYLFWQDRNTTPYYASCASMNAQVFSYVVYGPPNLVQAIPPPRVQPTAVTQPVVQTLTQPIAQTRTAPIGPNQAPNPQPTGPLRPRGMGVSHGTPNPTPNPTPLRPRAGGVGASGAPSGVRALIARFQG